jgi:dCTP deaminase
MVKNDKWIKKMSLEHKMIEPFETKQIKEGKISFGTSSYGYDMRLSNEFMVMKTYFEHEDKKNRNKIITNFVLDPKKTIDDIFKTLKIKNYIEIPPNSTVLGKSVEYFRIPRNVITIAFGKSTYARCGVLVNLTPFEPEWEGYVTLSIANTTVIPVRVYVNEGIAQILFLSVSETCEVSYADKMGKYQAQKTIVSAKI